METRGWFAPEDEEALAEHYAAAATAADAVVREVARTVSADREEFDAYVTDEAIDTARDVLFASFLQVSVGTREEFEAWRKGFDGEVDVVGSDAVDGVAWHESPLVEQAVAVTFQAESDAAVDALRRQAFGRIYRELANDDER